MYKKYTCQIVFLGIHTYSKMCRQSGLVERERPDSKIVHLNDSIYLHKGVLHLGILETLGNTFHQNVNYVLDNSHRSEDD